MKGWIIEEAPTTIEEARLYGHMLGMYYPRTQAVKDVAEVIAKDAIHWACVRLAWLLARASGLGPVSVETVERAFLERD